MSDVRSWSRSVRRLPTSLQCFLALLLYALACGGALHAQFTAKTTNESLADYVQTTVNIVNGLPQNTVHSIVQGAKDYIWFATEEGFARYDGSRVETYDRNNVPGLRDNNIRSLAAAPDGSLWVATRSSVLHFQDGHVLSQLPSNRVYVVFCDKAGHVWVGNDHGLLAVADNERSTQLVFRTAPGNGVHSVQDDPAGGLWLLTDKGIVHFRNGNAQLLGREQGLPSDAFSAMTVDGDGTLWIAGTKELIHWSRRILGRFPLPRNDGRSIVNTMLQDRSGEIWLGFEHDGVARLHGNRLLRYTMENGAPSDDVETLQKDRSGNVWVGLEDSGAVSLHVGLFRTFGKPEGMADSRILSLLAAKDGSLWAGVNAEGLDHLLVSGRVEHYSHAKGFPYGLVLSLFEDYDRTIWVGLDSGDLVHIVAGQVHVFHDPSGTMSSLGCIERGPGGDLFLVYSRNNGLVRFHAGKFTHEPHAPAARPIVATRAADASLWIGTDRAGVYHWDGSVFTHFGEEQGLSSEFVTSIDVEASGLVWVGSGGGLSLIRNGRVTQFTPENGLFSYTVGSVTEDGLGYLWMSSNRGIFKVSRQELLDVADGKARTVQSITYGTSDGMRTAECNYGNVPTASRSPGGRLWFATSAGAASIDPRHSTHFAGRPNAEIEGIVVDNKPVPLVEPAVLGKGSHDMEVDFTAPDFLAARHLQFRYRLEGFDRSWVYAGKRRQAFYTHLPPGEYVLLVQAEDGWGWPQHSTSLAISVPPHLWQTTWFRGLCVISAILASFGIYNMRVFALRRRSIMLQQCVVQRTAELQDALRSAETAQQKLEDQATHDSLTRLWNRRHIFEMLRKEANRAKQHPFHLCVLMLDVDHFKKINDSAGHLGGDRVLEQVGAVLLEQTRSYDYAGRYGGEEFLMILRNCTLEAGLRRSEAIRAAIESMQVEYDGTPIPVTASCGLAELKQGGSIEAALKEADFALYLAKQAGRNRVCTAADFHSSKDEGLFHQHGGYPV